jgi:hypothetical protein
MRDALGEREKLKRFNASTVSGLRFQLSAFSFQRFSFQRFSFQRFSL